MLGRQAGSTGFNMRKYNAKSPKQGSKRFNSIVKTKYIADLGIIYLCLPLTTGRGAAIATQSLRAVLENLTDDAITHSSM